jgi:hypothetical protein
MKASTAIIDKPTAVPQASFFCKKDDVSVVARNHTAGQQAPD